MKIEFKNVIPNPLKNELNKTGDLWGKQIQFDSTKNYLIDASSGKGKSTLTSLIAGIRQDYEGEILFDGRDINTLSRTEWTKIRATKISFIFQDLQLFEKLSVKENLLLKNTITNFMEESEIKMMLDLVGLGAKWEQKCGLLSLGQQQRVSILRALLQPADFIVMDEPFSHLDSANVEILNSLIIDHCQKNKTGIILTTLGDKYTILWDKIIQIE